MAPYFFFGISTPKLTKLANKIHFGTKSSQKTQHTVLIHWFDNVKAIDSIKRYSNEYWCNKLFYFLPETRRTRTKKTLSLSSMTCHALAVSVWSGTISQAVLSSTYGSTCLEQLARKRSWWHHHRERSYHLQVQSAWVPYLMCLKTHLAPQSTSCHEPLIRP